MVTVVETELLGATGFAMSDDKIYRASTTAPVNIAVIKFAASPLYIRSMIIDLL